MYKPGTAKIAERPQEAAMAITVRSLMDRPFFPTAAPDRCGRSWHLVLSPLPVKSSSIGYLLSPVSDFRGERNCDNAHPASGSEVPLRCADQAIQAFGTPFSSRVFHALSTISPCRNFFNKADRQRRGLGAFRLR